MAATTALVLLICINYSLGYYSFIDESQNLTWPEEFHLKAEKIDLNSGIMETMELWSSATYNRSRMDFYDGLVKKYYYWEMDDRSGYVYNLIPESTEKYQNKIVCMETDIDDEGPSNLLPEVDHYEFIGEEELEGRQVKVWKYEMVTNKVKLVERTFYTYPSSEGDAEVPVRFIAKNFLTTNGAMTAYTIVNYFGYESKVEEKDLEAKDTEHCGFMRLLGEDFHTDIEHLHPAKESDVNIAFNSYKKHHGKSYNSESEHEMRKAIFHENWQMIVNHNRHNHDYKMALNRFADYTAEELDSFTGLLPSSPSPGTHPFPHSDEEVRILAEELPETYDMRLEGIISPVKNQAQCGSCWAFSSTAAVEGALARSNGGRVVDLSEQSLVDCAWGLGCAGCNGGVMELSFRYILKHGIPMETEYGSYLEQDGLCHRNNMTTIYKIKGYAKPTAYNPLALKVALYKYGPVAISINFNKKMGFYASGIFYDPDCNEGHTNHGVVVVGYGTRAGVDYWIVKNSHGAAWGQAGYILISAADNNCFVLSDPMYPIV